MTMHKCLKSRTLPKCVRQHRTRKKCTAQQIKKSSVCVCASFGCYVRRKWALMFAGKKIMIIWFTISRHFHSVGHDSLKPNKHYSHVHTYKSPASEWTAWNKINGIISRRICAGTKKRKPPLPSNWYKKSFLIFVHVLNTNFNTSYISNDQFWTIKNACGDLRQTSEGSQRLD